VIGDNPGLPRDMTSLDPHSFSVAALGQQHQSQRKSQPCYPISKVSREARDKVFISHNHAKTSKLCRQSPIGGPIYDIPTSLNTKNGVKFTEGKSSEFMTGFGKKEDTMDSNDELKILIDSQQFKYARDATILIGTDPRGKLKDAELIKNHQAAFFGKESPGPAAIGDKYGPNFALTKKKLGYSMPFGKKVKSNWQSVSSLPENVAPGMYPRKDDSVGQQYLSHRINQPCNAFGRAPKFAKDRSADSITTLDAAKSSLGKQCLSKNRSEQTVGFVNGTRDGRSRTAICMTKEDLGPKAFMPKPFHSMPVLPKEVDVMKSGWM